MALQFLFSSRRTQFHHNSFIHSQFSIKLSLLIRQLTLNFVFVVNVHAEFTQSLLDCLSKLADGKARSEISFVFRDYRHILREGVVLDICYFYFILHSILVLAFEP